MKKLIAITILTLLLSLLIADEKTDNVVDTSVRISGQWFMAYRGNIPSEGDDTFGLKRGYLTFKKNLNETFSIRYTQDITIDDEGDDAGNVEIRFKYCYIKMDLPELLFFTDPFIEVGLVHQPWLEFEQKINTYRVQGNMFLDRFKVTSSADFGFNAVALLGGKLDEEARKKVDSSLPGKYGSVSFGVYNGGGYHAVEVNNNKTVEGRLSLRPFPGFLPGLQISYAGAFGKANDSLSAPYHMNVIYLTHETLKTTLAAQYYTGRGFHGESGGLNHGVSVFAEACIPFTPLIIFGRYDYFSENIPMSLPSSYGPTTHYVTIAGIAWKFYKNNRLLLDIERSHAYGFSDPWSSSMDVLYDNTFVEMALEIVF